MEDRVDETVCVAKPDFVLVRDPEALTEGLRVPVDVRVEVMVELGDRVPVAVRVTVVDRVPVRVEDMVVVPVRDSRAVRVLVTVRVIAGVPVAVCVVREVGVDAIVGLGDLEGNPERVAVRVVDAVCVGTTATPARFRSGL